MRFRRSIRVLLLGAPVAAGAHSFAPPYTLPVPFSLYAFGAAAALVLSFVMVGVFASAPAIGRVPLATDEAAGGVPRGGWLLRLGRLLALVLLVFHGLLSFSKQYFVSGNVLHQDTPQLICGCFHIKFKLNSSLLKFGITETNTSQFSLN